jgi:hypothetical protein
MLGDTFTEFRSLALWDDRERPELQTLPQALSLGFEGIPGGRMKLSTQGQNPLKQRPPTFGVFGASTLKGRNSCRVWMTLAPRRGAIVFHEFGSSRDSLTKVWANVS